MFKKLGYSTNSAYIPQPSDWKCSCGEMNFRSRTECRKCGNSKFNDTKLERIETPEHL